MAGRAYPTPSIYIMVMIGVALLDLMKHYSNEIVLAEHNDRN